jgi:polyhydroxybutyrate depolymerase
MNRQWCLLVSWLMVSCPWAAFAGAGDFQQWDFTVDGVARTALVYVPPSAKTNNAPVVFVFHGHGGSARQATISFAMDQQWPEAISVYMQGLDTPGQLTDPGGNRPGWQALAGDQGDRDLKFFDAMLARLEKDCKVDEKRIYCTGHSNGGAFTYLLWLARPGVFTAVAPSAAAAKFANKLTPKPALICGGEDDPLVKPAWQRLTMAAVRRVNGCEPAGKPWGKGCTFYPSEKGTPVVTFIYPGGHELNPATPSLIVKFFKENPGKTVK